jgi:hypothetical protein
MGIASLLAIINFPFLGVYKSFIVNGYQHDHLIYYFILVPFILLSLRLLSQFYLPDFGYNGLEIFKSGTFFKVVINVEEIKDVLIGRVKVKGASLYELILHFSHYNVKVEFESDVNKYLHISDNKRAIRIPMEHKGAKDILNLIKGKRPDLKIINEFEG